MLNVGFVPLFSIQKPSSRYRIYQFLKPLSEAGFNINLLEAPERNPRIRMMYLPRLLKLVRGSDVIYIQKRLIPKSIINVVKKTNPRLVFDIDDAIFLRDQLREQVNLMLEKASIVVVGNEFLANYARNFNRNVEIIPTVVDTDYYFPSSDFRPHNKNVIVIGWIGMNPNRGDFENFYPVMDWLVQKYRDSVRIHIVGEKPLDYQKESNIKFIPWTLNSARVALQRFDIGIMPLDDTPWNWGKCGLKLIQYMAVGAATIASPIGVNQEIILDGQTGFLAKTNEDWIEYLGRLIENEKLRIMMGEQGVIRVKKIYSIQSVLPKFIEVLINL
jgi:glycosyltransferase involved in cell wall biosynthesis